MMCRQPLCMQQMGKPGFLALLQAVVSALCALSTETWCGEHHVS